MAVAFDAVGPSAAGAAVGNAAALSWSHTCTGSNLVLLVGCALGIGADGGKSMTATYGGVAMTSLGVVHDNNQTAGFVQLWRLAGPATGANTVTVTAAGGTPSTLVGGSVSFTGADQTTPVGTPVTAAGAGTTASVALASTTAGNMVADVVANGSPVGASGKTLAWRNNDSTSTAAGNAAQSTAAAGGAVTMSYGLTSDWWGIIAVEVLASSAATLAGSAALAGAGSFGGSAVAATTAAAGFGGAAAVSAAATVPLLAAASLAGAGAVAAAGVAGGAPATTAALYAGSATALSGTWANTAGAVGAGVGDYATWTSSAGGDSATLELAGFGADAVVPAGSSIESVDITVRHYESDTAAIGSVQAELYIGSTPLASLVTLTRRTVDGDDVFTVTGGITAADLANLRVRYTATRA